MSDLISQLINALMNFKRHPHQMSAGGAAFAGSSADSLHNANISILFCLYDNSEVLKYMGVNVDGMDNIMNVRSQS